MITLCLLLSVQIFSTAQDIDPAEFIKRFYSDLEGDWKGKIEFLQLYDDSTKTTVEGAMSFSPSDDGMGFFLFYVEPEGTLFRDNGNIRLGENLDTLYYDGEWNINHKEMNDQLIRIVAERDSYDNEKEAKLIEVITIVKGQRLSVIRQVVYTGETEVKEPFVRSAYDLQFAD